MALISYEVAAHHLRIDPVLSSPPTEEQLDVQLKMEQATAIVLHHIKRPDHGWTAETDPTTDTDFAIVQAAILKVLANLDRFRGDDMPSTGPLTPDIVAMLSMQRDPAFA